MHRWVKEFNFITAAFCANVLVVALTSKEAAEDMEDLTIFAVRQDHRWRVFEDPYFCSIVDSVSISSPIPYAVFLGFQGEVLFVDGEKAVLQVISADSGEQPKNRGPMCGLGIIGDSLYAVGMGRQVYQLRTDGTWLCLDQSMRPAEGDESIVGLNSISGFSDDEIYSVGFNGEIWWQNTDRWIEVDSPTNMPLNCVFCDAGENVYVCGRNGTLLVGRRDKWSFIAKDETDDDLWSIARYDRKLYILGSHGLYLLNEENLTLIPDVTDNLDLGQCLLVSQGRLWLVGSADLLSYDGSSWSRVD